MRLLCHALGFLALAGCTGYIGEPQADRSAGGPSSPVDALEPSAAPSEHVPPGTTPTPFAVRRENIRLLPFETRLARLAALTGLPSSDPLFAPLLAKRLELGDYDHAQGVGADRSWTTSRLGLWIKLLKPICQSAAITGRFPDMAGSPAALLAATFGRSPSEAEVTAVLTGASRAEVTERSQVACLSVLSSLEFVAQ